MIFLVAGVRRSASTLAFQLACEISGAQFRVRRWKELPRHAITDRKNWWVAKTHAYLPDVPLGEKNVRIFSTIRDPRDIVVSIMQLYGYPDGKKSSCQEVLDRGWVQSDIEAQRKWKEHAWAYYTRMNYEDFYQGISSLANSIAFWMDTPISLDESLELADKYSYLNNRERSKEQNIIAEDMLFPNHVQTGMVEMWKYYLYDDEIFMIQDEIGHEWFRENGYEIWKK